MLDEEEVSREPPHLSGMFHSYFSRNVVAVDGFLLQKHVKTAFVLGERVAGDLVDELLQADSPLLDEGFLKEAFVLTERQLPLQGFARQRRYYNLAVSLQLIL